MFCYLLNLELLRTLQALVAHYSIGRVSGVLSSALLHSSLERPAGQASKHHFGTDDDDSDCDTYQARPLLPVDLLGSHCLRSARYSPKVENK